MDFTDTHLDRRMYSTDTNEYATGLLDENEWDEGMMDAAAGRFDDYDAAEHEPETLFSWHG